MKIFDQNPARFGLNTEITSLTDAEAVHDRLVKIDIKCALGGPLSMPHYRGEQQHGWKLLPNIFRMKNLQKDQMQLKELERKAFTEFETAIRINFGDEAMRTIFNNQKYGKEWDTFMQAQHAGIKTSLLDWSPNVYAPLYFATEFSKTVDIEKADGQFWVYMTPFEQILSHNEYPVINTFYNQHPQELKTGAMINVSTYLDDLSNRKYETRWFRQKGRFYISDQDHWNVAMDEQPAIIPLLFRFTIPAKHKSSIREELKLRGIDYDYLYGPFNPDHQKLINKINSDFFGV